MKYFDGANDGLVGEESFPWGENYQFLTVEGKRGISHGDVIDLNRENIPGFDVREFYVQLVADLKIKDCREKLLYVLKMCTYRNFFKRLIF